MRQAQNRNVKRAATQVVHGKHPFAAVVQAVGNGSRCGFVDQAQHIEASQLGGVFGGLALRVIKISRHGDDGAKQIVVERVFSAVAQGGQYVGADFYWAFRPCNCLHLHHAARIYQGIRQLAGVSNVLQRPTHQSLGRSNGIARVLGLMLQGFIANLSALGIGIAHHTRKHDPALRIGQAFGQAIAHRCHQRVGGAQIDTHRYAPLMRVGRLAGF